jgi:hypothetical protein
MSQRKDKAMRNVAKKMADELIPQLANNTNEVIMEMQATWPYEDKVQFCRWFLGLETMEDLMATLGEDTETEDKNQGLLICDGNHAEATPCADPECWHKGDSDAIKP